MSQVKYSKKLKAGLEWFIKKVEAMEPETEFTMELYHKCVIGKCLDKYRWSETTILKSKFDIRRNSGDCYFGEDSGNKFKPEHWEVIRLFTSSIGDTITAEQWLILAKDQLAKMNEVTK